MEEKLIISLFFVGMSCLVKLTNKEAELIGKDLNWFSSMMNNANLTKSDFNRLLLDLEELHDKMEYRKAEIEAELQLVEAYKEILRKV